MAASVWRQGAIAETQGAACAAKGEQSTPSVLSAAVLVLNAMMMMGMVYAAIQKQEAGQCVWAWHTTVRLGSTPLLCG